MIKFLLKKIVRALSIIGIDVIKLVGVLRGFPGFVYDYSKFRAQAGKDAFEICLYPVLADKYKQGGTTKGHYFHQDLLVAQKIFRANPERHIDVGSRIDGFVSHLASFREVTVVDIRDITTNVDNIKFKQADMMSVDPEVVPQCDSLSCLHALEHFGLGRYGDPIDADGHLRGFDNLYRLLLSRGILYFSVPIGSLRVEFNAHRVFSLRYLLDMFEGKFTIESFSFVDDHGDLNKNVALTSELIASNCGCEYGCGIFELRKN